MNSDGGRLHTRRQTLAAAAGRQFDLIVIGGGINGAGIARDAARRGLAVLLLERHDYGFGTTWRSTKLIHGGLRYLEHREFRLVFEGLRERATLLRTAPHLVRPLQFLLPVFSGGRYSPALIRAGMLMYDLLSYGKEMPRHKSLSRGEVARREPAVSRDGLRGGFTYFDGQVTFPERLCVENVISAVAAGARAFNHVEVTALITTGCRVAGVSARDDETGLTLDFRARAVVNAAGPWVDQVLRREGPSAYLGNTKGSHIVVDFAGAGPRHAIYAEAGSDGRPFFVVPWYGRHLIGTTDLPSTGDPARVLPETDEIAYLRRETARVLPGAPITDAMILYAFAGLRPLPRATGIDTGAITRRHFIRSHADAGHAGLFSIIGGKLTSYRHLAEEAVDAVCQELRITPARTETARTPLVPGGLPAGDSPITRHLTSIYGARASVVLALTRVDPALAVPLCPHGPDIGAQVVHAIRAEGARTLGDILLRRTPAGWNACRGIDAALSAARLAAPELGWDGAEIAAAVAGYRAEVDATLIPYGGAVPPKEGTPCSPR